MLLEGLRGAADYGTASAFKARGVSALAKTGTILMPSGAALGLVVALTPADKPTRAIVVAAPGGAGVDAAAIAAELVDARGRDSSLPTPIAARNGPVPHRRGNLQQGPDPLIRLGRTLADGSTRVETLQLDDYIAQVLAGEGQPQAGDAAQQALAITARTFALANRNRHRREGFDLCDTTHCQVVQAGDRDHAARRRIDERPRAAAPGAAGVRLLLRVVRRQVRAGVAGLARRDRLLVRARAA